MGNAYIVDACRTPRGIGKVGKGALAHLHPSYLGSTVLAAMAERNNLNTAEVDDIIWGTSSQTGKQGGDLGRMAALNAGYDVRSSGVTLDRFCGSGITTVNLAAAQIMSGMEDLVIAGGTEMMSYHGQIADPSKPPMIDSGNLDLRAMHPQSQQGVCADAIATNASCRIFQSPQGRARRIFKNQPPQPNGRGGQKCSWSKAATTRRRLQRNDRPTTRRAQVQKRRSKVPVTARIPRFQGQSWEPPPDQHRISRISPRRRRRRSHVYVPLRCFHVSSRPLHAVSDPSTGICPS